MENETQPQRDAQPDNYPAGQESFTGDRNTVREVGHETELALRESREHYQLLLENVKEYAIFMMDTEGRIVSWNPGARRILGFDEAEIIGQQGAIFFTEEDRRAGAVEAELTTAAQTGQAVDERWHVRKDGSHFWGSGVVTALRDGGQLQGFAKLLRDNTQRKQAEEALRQSQERLRALNETLEERVQEQTEQVRALAAELVVSEQKVRHRISQVLHDDLQQILYGLDMQLHFLGEDLKAGEVASSSRFEEMATMLQKSIRLTRQLAIELSPPVLHGEGVLEALNWLASYMRDAYDFKVTVEEEGEQRVADDEKRILLFQIVRELLFNVVKHAGVKQAQVVIEPYQDGLLVQVIDRGKGFAAETAFQGGLGLHNVRERVRLFGGELEIESRPGDGTRATVYVPVDLTGWHGDRRGS